MPALPVFPDRTAMPDDYHSVQEPSQFEYDSKETNPAEPEDIQDNYNKTTAHYGGKSSIYKKTQTYAVRHTDVQLPDPEPDEPNPPLNCEFDAGEVYDEGYYVAEIAMADEADQWGHCFNCGKEGHRWAECTKPLKDSLKQAKEWANHKNQLLNQDGGAGPKGAQSPQMGTAKANLAKAKN